MSLCARILLLCFVVTSACAEPITVRVGGYVFPPFAEVSSDGQWSGVTLDLIDCLNSLQAEHRFEFVPTAAARRYRDLEAGQFDVLFFENPAWGWQGHEVDNIAGFVLGRELFITQAKPGRSQDYFDDRSGKRIALFSGYHYAFTGFVSDPGHLRDVHNAVLTFSQESNIQLVLRERVDMAVVTESFLEAYLSRHPHYRSRLLIAEDPDQYYQHFLLMRPDAAPGIDQMKGYVKMLQESGVLSRMLEDNGINHTQP